MEHIVFRNEENGYTVLNLTAESGEITCVGNFQAVHEGEYLEAEGSIPPMPPTDSSSGRRHTGSKSLRAGWLWRGILAAGP